MDDIKITVKNDFDFKKIKMDFSHELNLIGGMIKKDIRTGIRVSREIDGGSMKSLHPFTVKEKGGITTPLMSEGVGTLSRVNKTRATRSKQVVIITPAESRTQPLKGYPHGIAEVQQRGATIRVTKKMRSYLRSRGLHLSKKTNVIRIPARPWFGISKSVMRAIPKLFHKRIDMELKRAKL